MNECTKGHSRECLTQRNRRDADTWSRFTFNQRSTKLHTSQYDAASSNKFSRQQLLAVATGAVKHVLVLVLVLSHAVKHVLVLVLVLSHAGGFGTCATIKLARSCAVHRQV